MLVRVAQLLAPVTPFVAERMYRNLVGARGHGLPASVHLARFPEPEAALEDAGLEAAVSFVRHALSLGLAARNSAGHKVRQPLARALVLAPAPMLRWLAEFEPDLLEELNVEALETAPAEVAVSAGLRGDRRVDWTSPSGAVIPLASDHGPFRVATNGDVVVALDTRLTPALERRGLARHLVHHVQLLRKAAGLSVGDRIRLSISVDPERELAIEEHRSYVCGETLAVELTFGPPPADSAIHEVRLPGGVARVGLQLAGPG